jgi:hypothetical protein
MRVKPLCCAVVFLVLSGLPTQAADLSKIDRTIAKEPKYQGKPEYCLLVIGPEAKQCVWLVVDGTTLYVDRNGNGDLTDPDERVLPGDRGLLTQIPTANGKATYNLRVCKHDGAFEMYVRASRQDFHLVGFDGPGRLRFAEKPRDAPIIHCFGPLTLKQFEPQPGCVSPHLKALPLVRGQQVNLAFSLGTPGLGSGTFAKFAFDERSNATAEVCLPDGKTITVELKPDG